MHRQQLLLLIITILFFFLPTNLQAYPEAFLGDWQGQDSNGAIRFKRVDGDGPIVGIVTQPIGFRMDSYDCIHQAGAFIFSELKSINGKPGARSEYTSCELDEYGYPYIYTTEMTIDDAGVLKISIQYDDYKEESGYTCDYLLRDVEQFSHSFSIDLDAVGKLFNGSSPWDGKTWYSHSTISGGGEVWWESGNEPADNFGEGVISVTHHNVYYPKWSPKLTIRVDTTTKDLFGVWYAMCLKMNGSVIMNSTAKTAYKCANCTRAQIIICDELGGSKDKLIFQIEDTEYIQYIKAESNKVKVSFNDSGSWIPPEDYNKTPSNSKELKSTVDNIKRIAKQVKGKSEEEDSSKYYLAQLSEALEAVANNSSFSKKAIKLTNACRKSLDKFITKANEDTKGNKKFQKVLRKLRSKLSRKIKKLIKQAKKES